MAATVSWLTSARVSRVALPVGTDGGITCFLGVRSYTSGCGGGAVGWGRGLIPGGLVAGDGLIAGAGNSFSASVS